MLSYQHIYHAGGWADLHKHAILCALWAFLQDQHDTLVYGESHAGRGVYDLGSAEAQKTKEYESGVVHLSGHRFPSSLLPYKKALEHWMPLYAGSPACVVALKRPDDEVVLCELHPGEFTHLKRAFESFKQVSCFKEDGHSGLQNQLLQQKGVRGLVLLDPSFEVKTEYKQTAQTALALRAAFPEMAVLIWYPVIHGREYHQSLEDALENRVKDCAGNVSGAGGFFSSRFMPPMPPTKGMVESRLALLGAPTGFDTVMGRVENDLLSLLSRGSKHA